MKTETDASGTWEVSENPYNKCKVRHLITPSVEYLANLPAPKKDPNEILKEEVAAAATIEQKVAAVLKFLGAE